MNIRLRCFRRTFEKFLSALLSPYFLRLPAAIFSLYYREWTFQSSRIVLEIETENLRSLAFLWWVLLFRRTRLQVTFSPLCEHLSLSLSHHTYGQVLTARGAFPPVIMMYRIAPVSRFIDASPFRRLTCGAEWGVFVWALTSKTLPSIHSAFQSQGYNGAMSLWMPQPVKAAK